MVQETSSLVFTRDLVGFECWFVLNEECDLSKTIPLVIHGDDAESHRRRGFQVTTVASLLTPKKSSWDSRFVLWCLDNSRAVDETIYIYFGEMALLEPSGIELGGLFGCGSLGRAISTSR